jgi:hypothetical protein
MSVEPGKELTYIRLTNARPILIPSGLLIVLTLLGTRAAYNQGMLVCAAPLVIAAGLLLMMLAATAFRYLSVTIYEDRLTIRKPFRSLTFRWDEVMHYQTSGEASTTRHGRGPFAPLWLLILFPDGWTTHSFHTRYVFSLKNGDVVPLISDARLSELNAIIEPRLYTHLLPDMRAKFDAGEALLLHSRLRYSLKGMEIARIKGTGKRRRIEAVHVNWDQYSGRIGEEVFTIMAGNEKAASLPIGELINFYGFQRIAREMTKLASIQPMENP